MNMQVANPFAKLAQRCACRCCPSPVPTRYVVDYCILPTRFVRKRHREKEQKVVLCTTCYEPADFLPLLIDGKSRRLQTSGAIFGHESVACWQCTMRAFP
jgi:hypothetical protein